MEGGEQRRKCGKDLKEHAGHEAPPFTPPTRGSGPDKARVEGVVDRG